VRFFSLCQSAQGKLRHPWYSSGGVPWGEAGGRITALFETLVIDWLHEASVSAVCRELKLSWDQVAHIQQRAVLGLCLVQWCRTPRAHRVWCRWRRHN
jgi:hypothetical protein